MKLSAIAAAYKRSQRKMDRALSKEVERLARGVLLKHSDLDEFIMGMGGWFFTEKTEDATGNVLHDSEKDPRFKSVTRFMDKWDDEFNISGEPMRFTATSHKVTEWDSMDTVEQRQAAYAKAR